MRESFRACGSKLPGGSCLIIVGTEGGEEGCKFAGGGRVSSLSPQIAEEDCSPVGSARDNRGDYELLAHFDLLRGQLERPLERIDSSRTIAGDEPGQAEMGQDCRIVWGERG